MEFRVVSIREDVVILDVSKFDVATVFPTKFWAI